MGIRTKIANLLTKAVRTNIVIIAPAIAAAVGAKEVLSKLLSSDEEDLQVGDTFEKNNPQKTEEVVYDRKTVKDSKKKVYKNHKVSRWNRMVYVFKDFFRDQDFEEKVRRKYNLSKSATEEELIDAAHRYIQEELEGLTADEIDKKYAELEKKFALDITHSDGDEDDLTNTLYSATLGDFKADKRADMAGELISVQPTSTQKNKIAVSLFDNAEYNVTNPDAYGNVPTQDESMEYFSTTFGNMNTRDAENSVGKLGTRSKEIENRIKELEAKGSLTEEEQAELNKLRLLHNNYVVSGHGGAEVGIASNPFMGQGDAERLLDEVQKNIQNLGIENEVNKLIDRYLQAHPEMAEKIKELRKMDFESLIEKIRSGFLSLPEHNVKSKSGEGGDADGGGSAKGGENDKRSAVDFSIGILTNPLRRRTQFGNLTRGGMPAKASNHSAEEENTYKDTKDTGTTEEKSVEKYVKQKTAKTDVDALHKVMQGGLAGYLEFKKTNDLDSLSSYADILNYKQASASVKEYAWRKFEALDKSLKIYIFPRLNTSAQIEAARRMDLAEVGSIKVFKSTYAKESVEEQYEEEMKQTNPKEFVQKQYEDEMLNKYPRVISPDAA